MRSNKYHRTVHNILQPDNITQRSQLSHQYSATGCYSLPRQEWDISTAILITQSLLMTDVTKLSPTAAATSLIDDDNDCYSGTSQYSQQLFMTTNARLQSEENFYFMCLIVFLITKY
uniref:Uncharacterized protein n=1 Tax=Homalodisca liturata TaxID=320908 RepID=A0A1B6J8X3_9HEMI